MFNQVALSLFDQHCHRILWRDFDVNREPDQYVLTSASFGDKCAGIIAMLALKFTAERYLERFPIAANIIIRNSYVDDIIGGAGEAASTFKIMEEIEPKLMYVMYMPDWDKETNERAIVMIDTMSKMRQLPFTDHSTMGDFLMTHKFLYLYQFYDLQNPLLA